MRLKRSLLILLLLTLSLLSSCTSHDLKPHPLEGMFYSGKDGTERLFVDETRGDVVRIWNRTTDDSLLDDLKDGDVIEVMMNEVFASSPGSMPIYDMKLLKRGSREDLPEALIIRYEEIIESLRAEFEKDEHE